VEVLRLAAIEESYRGPLLRSLAARAGDLARHDSSLAAPHVGQGGADAQVVACIDVRSERLRRHLEAAGPWETLGAAGFFGLPFRHVGVAGEGSDRLPALLLPTRVVTEQATPAAAPEWLAPDLADGIHALESRPALPFALAEASGWITGPLAALRTVAPASWARMRARADAAAGMPAAGVLGVERDQEHPDGFTHDELVDAAAGFLLSTGITAPAPLVVLLGHGGSAPNNPHAAAYDCGACGGHAGGVNARAMAQVLNDPRVRASLRARGLDVPDSTWFVPAVHDTTRDRVRFLDEVPGSHRALAERLMRDLDGSTDRVAAERLPLLPDADGSPARPRGREGRAADWAQVRPEWGLARNAAIIVGPRSLTTGLDLDGRTFLQSYQPGVDDDGAIVEALMAAPVVVAQWISSQYLFSTLDPERFGAGDKTTHNVLVPEDGRPSPLSAVVTGPRGDLRLGLPWQAVGASAPQAGQWQDLPYHCPQRLLAVICASPERIDAVLERQPGVARVVRGEWIALAAVDPQTGVVSRRRADGVWLPVPAEAVAADAEAMEHADRR
jgi:uncharacterized protein YbcC (UPF0753/DUF2309 family)